MSAIPEQELAALRAEIVALVGQRIDSLADVALELSIDIALHTSSDPAGPVGDRYDLALDLAPSTGLDYTLIEDSAVAGLPNRQKYLAVAWRYADVADFRQTNAASRSGWPRQGADVLSLAYRAAARRLIESTLKRARLLLYRPRPFREKAIRKSCPRRPERARANLSRCSRAL